MQNRKPVDVPARRSLGIKNKKPLTTGEVAKQCHVSRVAVLNWLKAGKRDANCLPGGHYRVQKQAFLEFLEKYKIPVNGEIWRDRYTIQTTVEGIKAIN